MEKRESQEKLGTMPVGKLLAVMSLPMMISMLVQALYNAVDAMFVARLSEDALTAVSLAFPFQNVMIAVGVAPGWGSAPWCPGPWAGGTGRRRNGPPTPPSRWRAPRRKRTKFSRKWAEEAVPNRLSPTHKEDSWQ